MARILFWLIQTKFWRWFLTKSFIPYIRFTTYYPSLTGSDYQGGWEQSLPGDIILMRDNKKLTTALIGGEFTHAGLVTSMDGSMVDMTHEDFRHGHLFDAFKESDRVAIYRVTDDEHEQGRLASAALNLDGAKYDVQFKLGAKFLYCSELVYMAYKDAGIDLDVNLEDLAGLGIPYISPTGLSKAKNARCVYDSDIG